MKRFQKATMLSVMILSLVFLNLHSGEEKVVDKTFKPCDNVKIKVVSGECIVKKGKNSEIKVHLVYTFSDQKYKPVFIVEGDTLVLKEEFTKSKQHNGRSAWTVTVPEKTNIEAKTASGNISTSGLKSNIKARVASGDINIADCKGELIADAASGEITVKEAVGKLRLNTASGDISVADSEGVLDVKCASGDIDISGIVIKGGSSFKAVSGDIEVKLAKTCEYDLDLNNVSGDIILDYNGNPITGSFKFSGQKGNIKSCVPFDSKDESRYGPFTKGYFTKGGDSPEITIKTVSGNLILKK